MHIPADVRDDAIGVVRLIALAIPPLAHGVALRGVLEAGQRFRIVNQLRVPLGIASYAGPLIALPFGASAAVAVGIVVAARIGYWLAHFFVLDSVAPGISRPRAVSRVAVRELVSVGGWITVSNIVSPIIVQADRIAVATLFPIAASGWYGSAAEVATKQWLFTAALQPVLFSALSAAIKPAPARAAELMERAARVTLLALLPAAILLVAFAEPGLRAWIGPAYSPDAGPVLRWLTVAVYVNAVAQVPYSVLQGGIDARAPALLHLIELPLYLALLFWLAATLGVRGVAIAWFVRMSIDGVVLWWMLYRRFDASRPIVWRIGRLADSVSRRTRLRRGVGREDLVKTDGVGNPIVAIHEAIRDRRRRRALRLHAWRRRRAQSSADSAACDAVRPSRRRDSTVACCPHRSHHVANDCRLRFPSPSPPTVTSHFSNCWSCRDSSASVSRSRCSRSVRSMGERRWRWR